MSSYISCKCSFTHNCCQRRVNQLVLKYVNGRLSEDLYTRIHVLVHPPKRNRVINYRLIIHVENEDYHAAAASLSRLYR